MGRPMCCLFSGCLAVPVCSGGGDGVARRAGTRCPSPSRLGPFQHWEGWRRSRARRPKGTVEPGYRVSGIREESLCRLHERMLVCCVFCAVGPFHFISPTVGSPRLPRRRKRQERIAGEARRLLERYAPTKPPSVPSRCSLAWSAARDRSSVEGFGVAGGKAAGGCTISTLRFSRLVCLPLQHRPSSSFPGHGHPGRAVALSRCYSSYIQKPPPL